MSEPSEPVAGADSPGAQLRAARERQGLHIAALAAAIKVSPRKLDALENDRWSELPDATFTRALAQTVCRTLKIDPKPVLDRLPAPAAVALQAQDSGLNAPFRERGSAASDGAALAGVRPLVWAAGLLMLAAVVVYFLPPGLFDRAAPAPAASAPVVAAPVALAPSPSVADVPAAAASVAASAVPASVGASGATVPATAASAVAAPVPGGETVFSAPPPGASAPAPVGALQISTREPSWVDVRDGRGATLLSRTVMPGERVGLDGAAPLRLTIGNAAATEVGFRGQKIDLAGRTRDNVARLELP